VRFLHLGTDFKVHESSLPLQLLQRRVEDVLGRIFRRRRGLLVSSWVLVFLVCSASADAVCVVVLVCWCFSNAPRPDLTLVDLAGGILLHRSCSLAPNLLLTGRPRTAVHGRQGPGRRRAVASGHGHNEPSRGLPASKILLSHCAGAFYVLALAPLERGPGGRLGCCFVWQGFVSRAVHP